MTGVITDEMLVALAEGRLPPGEAADMQRRLASDRALAGRYAALTGAGGGPEVSQAAASFRPRAVLRGLVSMGLALAVVLACGIGFLAGRATAPPSPGQSLVAALALDGVRTGGDVPLTDGRTAQVMGSFQTMLGFCRLIAVNAPAAGRDLAVACKDSAEWRVMLTVADSGRDDPGSVGDVDLAVTRQYLAEIGAGAPLGSEAETEVMNRLQ